MLIKTLEAKQAHPFASKIPLAVWNRNFWNGLNDTTIPGSHQLLNNVKRSDLPQDNAEACIILMLRYADVPAPQLLDQLSKLAFKDELIFEYVCSLGRLDMLVMIKEREPDRIQAMISANIYIAFCRACENGHLNVLTWLKTEAPDKLQDMISARDYKAFFAASENGHLHVLTWLKTEAPDKLQDMISTLDYDAFCGASTNGHLNVLTWLKTEAPDKLQDMISAYDYGAFHNASQNGHVNVLTWHKAEAPDMLQDMISARDYNAFRSASNKDRLDACKWLLEESNDLLAHAEAHHQENRFAHSIYPFINEKIATLHQERDRAFVADPNAVFDVTDPQKAQQYFYIMRHLVRRNEPALNEELRFLLDIPALKALAHQADNRSENALIRLAMATGNHEASTALLNIEAVRTLSAQNNFYQNEMQNGVDLAQLAANRESSMTALTPGEAKRLKNALDRYEPLLKQAGISHIMEDLRDTLVERYHANPATIMVNNETLVLPLDYEGFESLQLQGDDLQNALVAYYQHDAHTTLRYLSKPNAWMHPDAAYVNVRVYYINEDNTKSDEPKSDNSRKVVERWSTFDDYQDLISLQYLATIDKTSEPTNGHTFDSRLEMFIKEVALIGRAHNWDKTRIRNGKEEEYEDLEADNPSCYSGVKRRLFQAVHGHALFSFLTQDIVNRELLKHIQMHFKENFKDEHRADLAAVLDCVRDGDDIPEDVFNRLSTLNITAEKMESILSKMMSDFTDKYGTDAFLSHIAFIKEKFKLPDDNQKPDKRMTHLMKFYTSADLERILKKTTEPAPSVAGVFGVKDKKREENENAAANSTSSKTPSPGSSRGDG